RVEHHVPPMVRRPALLAALACALALLASAPAGAAVARLTPAAAPPGARVAVAGAGFPAGRPVLVRLASGTVASAVAGADGTVTARATRSGNARARLTLSAAGGIGGLATVRFPRGTLATPTYTLPLGVAVPPLPPLTREVPLLTTAGDIACAPGRQRTATVCHQ